MVPASCSKRYSRKFLSHFGVSSLTADDCRSESPLVNESSFVTYNFSCHCYIRDGTHTMILMVWAGVNIGIARLNYRDPSFCPFHLDKFHNASDTSSIDPLATGIVLSPLPSIPDNSASSTKGSSSLSIRVGRSP